MPKSICAVFVCNKGYFVKFIDTCTTLLTNGKYSGPICLIVGDDLDADTVRQHEFIVKHGIIVKHFPEIVFSEYAIRKMRSLEGGWDGTKRMITWHKLRTYDVYFKQWEYIFYIDVGMTIYSDVTPILNEATENTLLAHSDAYPTYEWRLRNQFDTTKPEFAKLASKYNLDVDYHQSAMMLYHTSIITPATYAELVALAMEYPISKTNDQGIQALYFTNVKPVFKQIRIRNETTCFYDFSKRNDMDAYIMLKYGPQPKSGG